VVHALRWSSDGSRLTTIGDDHTICIWDVVTEEAVAVLLGRPSRVRTVAWSADGSSIAADLEGTLCVWNLATGEHTVTDVGRDCRVKALAWSPDGPRIAGVGSDR